MISFGHRAIIGFEFGGLILVSEGVGAILSANLVLSPFYLQTVIPYAIGGVWTTTSGGTGWNIGGGLKIKLKENLAIRVEFRRWELFRESEIGAHSISLAVSSFF